VENKGLPTSVDTIIVNFRTKELTLAAVNSAIEEPETGKVIVVENNSDDYSYEWLDEHLPDRAELVMSEENLGFGGGNNLGLEHATADHIFLLNSDATLDTGSLAPLIARLEDPTVGIVAPAIYVPPDRHLQPDVLGNFPTPSKILTRKTNTDLENLEPDWVSGCAMLLRRQEMLDLGGFDENLFMYLEDVDLCKRYREKGQRIVREMTAGVVHLGGASVTSTKQQKEQFRKSTDYYLGKHGASGLSRATVRAAQSIYAKLRGL
jgi:GT2 family glycosyltransferase